MKIISKYNNTWMAYFGFQILFHILTVVGLLYSSWHWLWLSLVGIIFFRHIGVEIGAHRYFAHKSFKAKPWAKKLMAICGLFAYGGTHYAWIPFHRLHHQKSDTKLDPHSPHHMSFIDVYFTNWRVEVLDVKLYQDLIEDKFLQFLHRNDLIIVTTPLILFALIDWRISVFLFAIPSAFALHSGGLVNSIGHLYGYRNFDDTNDKSRNSTWVNILTLGEGLQNNHHAHPERYNFKMSNRWYETDFLNVFLIEKFLKA